MMKDLADKTNVCTSDPRYQEMLFFKREKARILVVRALY